MKNRSRFCMVTVKEDIMPLLKMFLLLSFIGFVPAQLYAQQRDLRGSWQLVKEGTCLEQIASVEKDSLVALREDMHSRAGATSQIIRFRDNAIFEESTRILTRAKSANMKKSLYKFNDDMLLILDKKSQTISDSYLIDKFTPDSLILSNASRPCETRMFVKISENKTN